MNPTGIVLMEFHPDQDDLAKGKQLRDGLSVALQIGDSLWLANDEAVTLERLTLVKGEHASEYKYAREHRQFAINDYLPLPIAPTGDPAEAQEVDVEGLAHADGYLWLVGSHSLKRKKPKLKGDVKKSQKQLAKCIAEANRYVLGRIPMLAKESSFELAKNATIDDRKLTAAMLPVRDDSNELLDALKDDEHLAPFMAIPGKDNGFDIEGLAVAGKRLFIGLRGPVLRGWAVVLELEAIEDDTDPSVLKLKAIGRGGRRYRKHFLQLGGLGIRDMCIHGDDLLILAGPTMDLDGPVTIYRWKDGAAPEEESMVEGDTLMKVLDVPFGQGVDHAEGMCLFSRDGGKPKALLVVYDAASVSRQLGEGALAADVFGLPEELGG